MNNNQYFWKLFTNVKMYSENIIYTLNIIIISDQVNTKQAYIFINNSSTINMQRNVPFVDTKHKIQSTKYIVSLDVWLVLLLFITDKG